MQSDGVGIAKGPLDQQDNPALIAKNNFKFKSLSDWSYNISYGCIHGCSFCYVPNTSAIKAEKRYEEKGYISDEWKAESSAGRHWADFHWGEYSILKSWNETEFLKSLKKAEQENDLTPDGNRAVMFCTTTDPYQTFKDPVNSEKMKLLNASARALVRKALELILTESTLNVRILTRSPLARKDFDLYKKFGNRLMFGMSLPTLDDKLNNIYEPGAPGPAAKLRTLKAAKDAGLHLYVAMAPTLPDDDYAELKDLLKTIAELKPLTIFHEPINLRAENVARIQAKANELSRTIKSEVFETRSRWRQYAFDQFMMVEQIAAELKIPDGVLHQWPDEDMASKSGFLKMKAHAYEREHRCARLPQHLNDEVEEEWHSNVEPWIDYWHNPRERVSAWAGIRAPKWK